MKIVKGIVMVARRAASAASDAYPRQTVCLPADTRTAGAARTCVATDHSRLPGIQIFRGATPCRSNEPLQVHIA